MGQLFAPLRRRWYTVAMLAAVCFAAAVLIGLRQPPGYQATALLEVQGLNDDFLNLKGLNPTAGDHAAEPDLQTQVKILQSSGLLGRIADKLQLEKRDEFRFAQDWATSLFRSPAPAGRERLLKELSKHLTARISVGTRIIEVTGESTDPKLASELANTAGKEFIDLTLARRLKNNQDTTRWLSDQLRDLKGSLEGSEQALQRYARATGLLFTSETDSVAEAKLRQLQEALSKAQSDRVQEQARYERAVASPPDSLPEVLDDSALKDYQVKLTDLRRQFAERSSTLTASHYKVRELHAQIAELETAFERGRANVLKRIKNQYDSALNRERLEAAAYSAQAGLVATQAAKSVHYKSLKQEADSNRQIYETMLQKVKEAGIATAVRATNVQLLNAAAVPESPAKPNLALYGAAGLMLGLFLGTTLAFAQGSGGRRIRTPGEAGSHLGCPELGAVPYAYGGRGGWLALGDPRQLGSGENGRGDRQAYPDSELSPELASWSGSRSPMAESIQAALAGVLFSAPRGQQPRVLVVTSASEGEGKTTIACNFALALAQMNQRVLLIDGHLRKPRLHDVFGIPNRQGFSDRLEGLGSRASQGVPECAPVDMAELDMNGLHVLPSGARSGTLVNHLCSPEIPRLFESWRREYDFIVIDAAPLTLLESRPLALAADGVVLVIGAGRTSQDTASASLSRLEADGANVLGIVLNDRGTGRTPVRNPRALVPAAPVSSFQTT